MIHGNRVTGLKTLKYWILLLETAKIYAATDMGVYSADIYNQGLSYFGNWDFVKSSKSFGKYTSAIYSGNKLYANLSDPLAGGDQVYAVDDTSSLFLFTVGVYNNSFDAATSGFTISSVLLIKYYNTNGSLLKHISSFGLGIPNISAGHC